MMSEGRILCIPKSITLRFGFKIHLRTKTKIRPKTCPSSRFRTELNLQVLLDLESSVGLLLLY